MRWLCWRLGRSWTQWHAAKTETRMRCGVVVPDKALVNCMDIAPYPEDCCEVCLGKTAPTLKLEKVA